METYLRNLQYENVEVHASRTNPQVKDRLERTAALMAYDKYAVTKDCPRLRDGYTKTMLKEGTFQIAKPTGDTWTHYPDAADYLLWEVATHLNITAPHGARQRKLGVAL